jgi:glycosyltransferase involved in cell wall biosynthesis
MSTNVSILIPTRDEEMNLPFALRSCTFADRVFVLDSGSKDRTEQVARDFGAEFVFHEWEGYARQKNWGLDNLPFRTDWIFILDADEEITPPLRDELVALATSQQATDKAGYYVNRYFIWRGQRINHCGYYPSWNLRFFRRGRARYEDRRVHEHMLVDGPVGYLTGDMCHNRERRGRDWLWQNHLRYAALEAAEMIDTVEGGAADHLPPSFFGNDIERRRAFKERVWPHLPARWLARFAYMYLWRRGFLDGLAGLDMCIFMARYEHEIQRQFLTLRDKRRQDHASRRPRAK